MSYMKIKEEHKDGIASLIHNQNCLINSDFACSKNICLNVALT